MDEAHEPGACREAFSRSARSADPGALLRDLQQRFALAQRVAEFGVWDWDLAANRLFCTPELGTIFGTPPGAHEHHPYEAWRDVLEPAELQRLGQLLADWVRSGHPYEQWDHTVRRGAETRWIAARGQLVCDAAGTPERMLVVSVDVTSRRQTESSLRETEEFNRGIIAHSQDCIKILDLDGNLLFMSSGGVRKLGITDIQPLMNTSFIGFFDAADQPRVREAVAAASRGGTGQFQAFCGGPSGEMRFWDVVVTPIFGEQQCPQRLLCISRDITESRRAVEDRLELERRTQQAQKLESLGVLASGIAHDFNNLLMGIMGNLQCALGTLPVDTSVRADIDRALHGARRAAELTRQMLAYAGRGRRVVHSLEPSPFLARLADTLQATLPSRAELEVRVAPDLPAIQADPDQLRQVVVNLVSNAMEALGEQPGRITLTAGVQEYSRVELEQSRLADKPPPGRYVWLEIADRGCGMDVATQERLFDPFFTTKFIGRGLGMSVVLGVVRGHGGALMLDSAPGQGTRVRILLPLVPPANAPGADASGSAAAGTAAF